MEVNQAQPSILNQNGGKNIMSDISASINELTNKDSRPSSSSSSIKPSSSQSIKEDKTTDLPKYVPHPHSLQNSKSSSNSSKANLLASRKSSMINVYQSEKGDLNKSTLSSNTHTPKNLNKTINNNNNNNNSSANTNTNSTQTNTRVNSSTSTRQSTTTHSPQTVSPNAIQLRELDGKKSDKKQLSVNESINDELQYDDVYTREFGQKPLLKKHSSSGANSDDSNISNHSNNNQEINLQSGEQENNSGATTNSTVSTHRSHSNHDSIENADSFNLLGLGSPRNTTDSIDAHMYDLRSDFKQGTGLSSEFDPREPVSVSLPIDHPYNKYIASQQIKNASYAFGRRTDFPKELDPSLDPREPAPSC